MKLKEVFFIYNLDKFQKLLVANQLFIHTVYHFKNFNL